MHQWKVPLKYQAMLLFPSGPLGARAGSGHHGLGGFLRSGENKNLQVHTF